MAGAVAPTTTPKTTVSLGPLYQQALAQAKASLQPQIDTVAGEQSGADAAAKQQAIDAQNAGDTASSMISSLISPVAGAYQAAGQNQELAANGFSQGLQDALKGNTDNLNSVLSKFNDPVQLDSHASQAGDLLYSLGGYNPGTTFAKQGAAAAAGLAGTASSASLLGLENSKDIKAKALLADQGFQNKIAELAAKLPGDTETNYQKLQTLALENKKFALQVKQDKINNAFKTASQNLATAKYKTSVDEFNARQTLSYARLNQQARQFAVRQSNSDRSYALSLARLGISEKNQQMKVAAQEYKLQNGGFTATQIARYNSQIQTIANAIHTVKSPDGSEQFFVPKSKTEAAAGKATLAISYTDFVKQAVAKGAPLSLVLDRANQIFPETQRPTPQDLAGATGLSQQAAAAGDNYQKTVSDYNQTVGLGSNGKPLVGTGPNGQQVTLQVKGRLTPTAKTMLQTASEYLGTPYAWGGGNASWPTKGIGRGANTVGFDCSGFAQFLYAKVGVNIPRTTYDQFQSGLPVPKGQLQPGDLVFFQGSDARGGLPGHVGVYIGGGQMIDAPQTGDVVRVQSINRCLLYTSPSPRD